MPTEEVDTEPAGLGVADTMPSANTLRRCSRGTFEARDLDVLFEGLKRVIDASGFDSWSSGRGHDASVAPRHHVGTGRRRMGGLGDFTRRAYQGI